MNDKFEKNLHIVSELMTYFHCLGASSYKAEMSATDKGTNFILSAPVRHISKEKLAELSEVLNLPRQHEVEQMFWEISGEAGKSGELTLVGIMLDHAETEYKDGVLTVTALRLD